MHRKIYLFTTLFIIVFVGFLGGIMDIIKTQNVIDTALKLQYPLYFFTILGVFKIMGACALLLSKKLDSFKNIAYTGFAFDFVFAAYSHYSIKDSLFSIFLPIFILFLLFISYIYSNKFSLYKKDEIKMKKSYL